VIPQPYTPPIDIDLGTRFAQLESAASGELITSDPWIQVVEPEPVPCSVLGEPEHILLAAFGVSSADASAHDGNAFGGFIRTPDPALSWRDTPYSVFPGSRGLTADEAAVSESIFANLFEVID